MNLYQISTYYQQAFMSMADSDIPDETIDDTLEGLEGELVEKGRAVTAFCLNMSAEIDAMKAAEKRIADRRKMLENKQSRIMEYLKSNMARCGITEIKANDGSFVAKLYIGRDSAVVIDDAAAIPKDYMREIPATFQPDKATIKKAIADGFHVPGARIEKRDRLEVK